ncbi:MAG TPA: FAD-dependent oxidoreductase [Burkholderiales bacterium]|nr:FAD-dependent oxidoreductase [Burkholderiales bacterium]
MKRLVLVGAGRAHLAVLRALGAKPLPGAHVTVVSPQAAQVHAGMLPGLIAGHYFLEDATIDVAGLAARAHAEFVEGAVQALDLDRRRLRLADGRELAYDVASLNAVAAVDAALPGAELALPVKPVERLLRELGRPRHLALVGGGEAGAELAMALRHAGVHVTLFAEAFAGARLARALRRRGVDYRPGMTVDAIEPGPVVRSGASRQAFERVLLAGGPAAPGWLRAAGLAADARGFVLVERTLRSRSHPEVFAAGDCAVVHEAPQKSSAPPGRQGEVLEANLRAVVAGGPLAATVTSRRALSLVTCGARYAVASWDGWSAEGRWAWWWKDRMDRRWIRSLAG